MGCAVSSWDGMRGNSSDPISNMTLEKTALCGDMIAFRDGTTRLFRHMPIPLARAVGNLLYSHMA